MPIKVSWGSVAGQSPESRARPSLAGSVALFARWPRARRELSGAVRIVIWLQVVVEQSASKEAVCKDQPRLASGLRGWWPLQGAGAHSIAQPTYMGCHDYMAGEFDHQLRQGSARGALASLRGEPDAPRARVRTLGLTFVPSSRQDMPQSRRPARLTTRTRRSPKIW